MTKRVSLEVFGWLLFIALWVFLVFGLAHAADITLSWDPSDGATGYKIYMSTDNGQTWGDGLDLENVTEYQCHAPDAGLLLFRVSAYNDFGESIRNEAGAWYCGNWKPPIRPSGIGIQ